MVKPCSLLIEESSLFWITIIERKDTKIKVMKPLEETLSRTDMHAIWVKQASWGFPMNALYIQVAFFECFLQGCGTGDRKYSKLLSAAPIFTWGHHNKKLHSPSLICFLHHMPFLTQPQRDLCLLLWIFCLLNDCVNHYTRNTDKKIQQWKLLTTRLSRVISIWWAKCKNIFCTLLRSFNCHCSHTCRV